MEQGLQGSLRETGKGELDVRNTKTPQWRGQRSSDHDGGGQACSKQTTRPSGTSITSPSSTLSCGFPYPGVPWGDVAKGPGYRLCTSLSTVQRAHTSNGQ